MACKYFNNENTCREYLIILYIQKAPASCGKQFKKTTPGSRRIIKMECAEKFD